MKITLDAIRELVQRSGTLLGLIRDRNLAPDQSKRLIKTWGITEAAALLDKTPQGIHKAQKSGLVPAPAIPSKPGKRGAYTLEQINEMRRYFRALPYRASEDPLAILAVQNFKGGVAKSTIAVHLAQYLARAGMRVALVDADPQASASYLMGYYPDRDLEWEDTLGPFLARERQDLRYAVRDTHWPGLKMIPSNMSLFSSEWTMALRISKSGRGVLGASNWLRLRDGLQGIATDFDVVIVDSPPSAGLISLNVIYAANMCLVPMPPSMLDFASTAQFFTMVEEVMSTLEDTYAGEVAPSLQWIKVCISRKQYRLGQKQKERDQTKAEDDISELARDHFGNYMMKSVLYESEEIKTATGMRNTLYELVEPIGTRRTHKRALETMDSVCRETELLIRLSWPSHVRQAEKMGLTA